MHQSDQTINYYERHRRSIAKFEGPSPSAEEYLGLDSWLESQFDSTGIRTGWKRNYNIISQYRMHDAHNEQKLWGTSIVVSLHSNFFFGGGGTVPRSSRIDAHLFNSERLLNE